MDQKNLIFLKKVKFSVLLSKNILKQHLTHLIYKIWQKIKIFRKYEYLIINKYKIIFCTFYI